MLDCGWFHGSNLLASWPSPEALHNPFKSIHTPGRNLGGSWTPWPVASFLGPSFFPPTVTTWAFQPLYSVCFCLDLPLSLVKQPQEVLPLRLSWIIRLLMQLAPAPLTWALSPGNSTAPSVILLHEWSKSFSQGLWMSLWQPSGFYAWPMWQTPRGSRPLGPDST